MSHKKQSHTGMGSKLFLLPSLRISGENISCIIPFLNKISINFKYDCYCHNVKSINVLIV